MAYTSLYRKYRPDTFDKVIGQDHIVRTLKNQIASGNIGHAYIFTGTRGTGKTSVAKIFARAVNCEHAVDGSPCGKCGVCLELALSGNFDVLEIDAASNNSVDQMRELTEKINFPPTIGKYKVYIIDEVHMLSKSAHNALLKTLEEPPAHAIFILATTEIHQIPATILSRCLRFDFRLVPAAKIAERLRYIFDDINVRYEPQAVELIATAGNGSVRDALSVADMCVSYCNGDVTYDGVLEVLGASDPKKLASLANAIAEGDLDTALKEISALCDLGKSIPVLASDLASLMRNVLYIKNCSAAKDILSLPADLYDELSLMAQKYSTEGCMRIMKLMSSLEGEFRYSAQHRILFEAAVAEACSSGVAASFEQLKALETKLAALEKKLTQRGGAIVNQPVKQDARSLLKAIAAELEIRNYKMLALSVLEAEAEIRGDTLVIKVAVKATLSILTDKRNRDVINSVFASISDLKLAFEEIKKLDDDKALPYLKSMFGDSLEIK